MRVLTRSISKVLFVFVWLAIVVGCTSPRRNTSYNRWLMGVNTRYNVYFNAEQSYIEALASMEKGLPADYATLIDLHPVDELHRQNHTSSSFDRSIEKCQKAITTRSFKVKVRRNPSKMRDPNYRAFLKQEEYNPFIHKAWLLLAQARYYKGELMNSLSTYLYIVHHFRHLPEVVQEAQIGTMRNYVAMGWIYEADDIIHQLKESTLLTEALRSEYNFELARLFLAKQQYKDAVIPLKKALQASMSKNQRVRLHFALAQLQQQSDDMMSAYQNYQKVLRMNPALDVEVAARIKQTELPVAGSRVQLISRLRSMQRNSRYSMYQDQLFYAMGNLRLQDKDTVQALSLYQAAVDSSKTGGMNKALPAASLGNLYFERFDYINAQKYYSEAAVLLRPNYPQYETVKRRAEVLDELVVYAQNVHLQDSLQSLVRMSEADRLTAINKMIERQKQEEALMVQQEALQKQIDEQQLNLDQARGQMPQNTTQTVSTPGDNSWYFYNTVLVTRGKSDFQQRWGSRKPEDNWRRRDKALQAGFSNDALAEEDAGKQDSVTSEDTGGVGNTKKPVSTDPLTVEYYLQQLPFTPEEMAQSDKIIQEGLFNMARIYAERLEDFKSSVLTYESLLSRFPQTDYMEETLYHLFLLGYRMNDSGLMERYRQLILTDYPQSKESAFLSKEDYLNRLQKGIRADEELYEQSYAAYLDNEMEVVQKNFETFSRDFPLSKIKPRFVFLRAMSFVPSGNTEEFRSSLRTLLKEYPESDVALPASEMLSQLTHGAQIAKGSTPSTGLSWKSQLLGDSADIASALIAEEKVQPFIYQPDTLHLLMVSFPIKTVNQNKLLFDIAAYNFTAFKMLAFDLETRIYGETGMVLIKGFESLAEVMEYKRRILLPDGMGNKFSEEVQLIPISNGNFDLLSKGRSIEEYLNFLSSSMAKQEAESMGTEE